MFTEKRSGALTLTRGRKDRDKYLIYLGGDSGRAAAPPSPSVISQTISSCIQTWYMDRVTLYLSLATRHLHFTFAHCQPWGCANVENVCWIVKGGGPEKCFNQNNYCLLEGAVSVCSSPCSPIFMTYWLANLISSWRVRKFSGKFLQIISIDFLFLSFPPQLNFYN